MTAQQAMIRPAMLCLCRRMCRVHLGLLPELRPQLLPLPCRHSRLLILRGARLPLSGRCRCDDAGESGSAVLESIEVTQTPTQTPAQTPTPQTPHRHRGLPSPAGLRPVCLPLPRQRLLAVISAATQAAQANPGMASSVAAMAPGLGAGDGGGLPGSYSDSGDDGATGHAKISSRGDFGRRGQVAARSASLISVVAREAAAAIRRAL